MSLMEGTHIDVGGGLQIHAIDAGSGPAVVFLHGSGPGASGWSNFKRNFPVFAERGFRTLVVDTLGFGLSSKPDNLDYGLVLLRGMLAHALDALGVETCAVIGNSHGGALAIQLALDDPERVTKLILMAPGGLEERETYMRMPGIRAMLKLVLGDQQMTRDGLRRVLEMQLYEKTLLTDEIVDERWEIAQTQPRRVLSTLHVPHLAPRLEELECPILGFWGMDDQFCPPSGAPTLAAAPRARVVTVEECGHWVMVERPEMFNRVAIDFLKEA